MSRALRRHPVVDKKAKQRQRPVMPTSGRRQQAPSGRAGLAALRPHWAEDIISELRKVTWPSREETWYLTLVVVVVASAFGVFLGGVDMFFNWAIEHTLLR